MATQKVKVYIYVLWNEYSHDWMLYPSSHPMGANSEAVLLEERMLEVEMPPNEKLTQAQVSVLRDAQAIVRAETEVKLNALETRIQQFLALPAPTEG